MIYRSFPYDAPIQVYDHEHQKIHIKKYIHILV